MNMNQIMTVVDFLDGDLSPAQVSRLMDEARGLGVDDKAALAELLAEYGCWEFYADMRCHEAEMGGYSRY